MKETWIELKDALKEAKEEWKKATLREKIEEVCAAVGLWLFVYVMIVLANALN